MKTSIKGLLGGLVVAALAVPALAADKSTEADALALMVKAQAYLKANGLEKSIVEFNNADGQFNSKSEINKVGDLYLFSIDKDGFQTIHGKNPRIRGTNKMDMRDQDGVFLIRELVKKCFAPGGKGWVNYRWPNPVSKEMEAKSGYIEKVPDHDLCLGTGIYK
jgi:cytochrome c